MQAQSIPQGNGSAIPDQQSLAFVLPPVMTIETAETLAAELKQLPLPEKTRLTLDASQVENITTPGLQLIVSLDKTLAAQGGALLINGQTEQLVHAFRDSGLESLLKQSL